MKHVARVSLCILVALVLTVLGVASGRSALAILTLPGRVFNHVMHFDSGPPEEGVVYGLSFNIVVIAGVLVLTLTALERLRSTRVGDGR